MAKIVTGGNGLVGSQFGSQYQKLGRNDADLTQKDETISVFKALAPDVVIHAAAEVGGLYSNMKWPDDYFIQNVNINNNVIKASRVAGVKKLVAFLSTCIFPDVVEYPLTEQKIHSGPPHSSNYGYAYAKRMMDVAIQTHNQQYGTNWFCVIPTNIYGVNDNFSVADGHVIPALIHKVFQARENKEVLKVPGNGSALREFIFARDVAAIVDRLIENYTDTTPVIISTSHEISIKEILEIIVELMNYKGKMEWLTEMSNGQHRKPSDTSKLKSILPDVKFTGIYEGLKETIQWFEANYPGVRK
jgi:GDP-L-fucose synthase